MFAVYLPAEKVVWTADITAVNPTPAQLPVLRVAVDALIVSSSTTTPGFRPTRRTPIGRRRARMSRRASAASVLASRAANTTTMSALHIRPSRRPVPLPSCRTSPPPRRRVARSSGPFNPEIVDHFELTAGGFGAGAVPRLSRRHGLPVVPASDLRRCSGRPEQGRGAHRAISEGWRRILASRPLSRT